MVIVCNIVKWEMVLNFKCTLQIEDNCDQKKKNYTANGKIIVQTFLMLSQC